MSTPVTTVDQASLTRQQRAVLPLSTDVAQAIAEQHGVCIRPLAMRRIDITTGRIEIVPVPCGSTREDQCQPCSDKARRLRMAPMPRRLAPGSRTHHPADKAQQRTTRIDGRPCGSIHRLRGMQSQR
jgi:hypothetical protein